MKKILLFTAVLSSFLWFSSCDPENVIDTDIDSDTLDYVWDITKVIQIKLNETTVECASSNVTISGQTVVITKKGTYELSGSLQNGQIVVNSSGIVRLLLNNVNIHSESTSAIYIADAKRAVIYLNEGSENTISDGSNYLVTSDSLNATIFSRDYMAIAGSGKLLLNANYNGGIYSRDELIIESGEITVNSVGAAIKGKDYLIINGGKFKVTSGGDGFKSDKDSTDNEGYVHVNNGEFDIVSVKDAISAQSELYIKNGSFRITTGGGSDFNSELVSAKAIKSSHKIIIDNGGFSIDCADNAIDADNHLIINGGNFVLNSANKPLDSDSTLTINGGTVQIVKSVKGISSNHITVNGGLVSVASRNDCMKATLGAELTTDDGSSIVINSGMVTLNSEKGDALDSNGSILIAGGAIVVQGSATKPDDAISYRSTFKLNGGSMYAVGATSLLPQNNSLQNTLAVNFSIIQPPGQIFCIQTEGGVTVAVFKALRYSYFYMTSIPGLQTGQTYHLYTGGSVTGTDLGGFYVDGIYTPGSKKATFTISQKLTMLNL
ncbi:MAG: carbohydrate-binding domain-containing protein [Paludibacteraceae bacterium]|nr:carbohydrate-binding domain-containing protein [Paludibacteraceae bacterium]